MSPYEMFFLFLLSILLSFSTTFFIIPMFIKFFRAIGLVGRDIMKDEKTYVPDAGGLPVITGFLVGIFFYIGIQVFWFRVSIQLIQILASISTVLIIEMIGICDVLTAFLGKREGNGKFERLKRKGIPYWMYFVLPLPSAIPLMAVNAGVKEMAFPIFGSINVGIFYPLVFIPVAILCCSNATNFLAGFNGLEAGMGIVLLTSIGLFSLYKNGFDASIISLTFAFSLLAFLYYNWYPAKIFPGDLNYAIGAVCVCVTVVGNIEKFAIISFTPWIIEAFLKARTKFKSESYGVLQKDGTVKSLYNKVSSLTHIVMKLGNFKEEQVSSILIILEMVVCILAFFLLEVTIK